MQAYNKPGVHTQTPDEDLQIHPVNLLRPASSASKARIRGTRRLTSTIENIPPEDGRLVCNKVSSAESLHRRTLQSASGSTSDINTQTDDDELDSTDIERLKRVSFMTERALSVIAKNTCLFLKLGLVRHFVYNCKRAALFSVQYSCSPFTYPIRCCKKLDEDGFMDFYEAYPQGHDAPFQRTPLNMRSFSFAVKDLISQKTILQFKRRCPFSLCGGLRDDTIRIEAPSAKKQFLGAVTVPIDRYGDVYEIEDEIGLIEFEIPPRIVTYDDEEFFFEVIEFQEENPQLEKRSKNKKNKQKPTNKKEDLEIVGLIKNPNQKQISSTKVPPQSPRQVLLKTTSSSSSSIIDAREEPGEGDVGGGGFFSYFRRASVRKSESRIIYPGQTSFEDEEDDYFDPIFMTPEYATHQYLLHIPERNQAWVARIYIEKRLDEQLVNDSITGSRLKAGEVLVLFNDNLVSVSSARRVLTEEQKARILGAAFFIRIRELSSIIPYPMIPKIFIPE